MFLENDSFDLDMEEYFAPPPPLSQSAPELNVTLPETPLIRFAVSSTELLYERAMARFYKAVEFEETENARKRSVSVEQETRRRSFSFDPDKKRLSLQNEQQDPALARLRFNSMTETERISVIKRRLSGDNPNLHLTIPRKLSFKDDSDDTHLNTIRNELNTPEMLESSPSTLAPPIAEGENFSSDYTDSTASSDDDEKEVPTRRSRQRTTNEIDTYHPRMLSPYRQPEFSEAAAVLTKPLPPLPDPNFVPKPILKRPASADGRRHVPNKPERKTLGEILGRRSASPSPSPRIQRKSVEIDEIPKIIQVREIQYSPEQIHKEIAAQDVPQIKVEEPKQPEPEYEPEPEPEFIVRPNEQARRKLLERRQSSLEENHSMADFYGDIIKDHSVRPVKPKVPIYMDPEALKKLEVDEDETQVDSGLTSSTDMSPQSTLTRPFSPPRGVSPVIGRRASEQVKAPPVVEKESMFGRRFSDIKVKHALDAPIQPLKDNLIKINNPPLNLPQPAAANDRLELNKSPSPQKTLFSNGSMLQKYDQISSTSSIDDVQARGRVIKPKTGAVPKRRNQSHSKSRESSSARSSAAAPAVVKNPLESTILTRREKSSSRTRNRSESKSPSMSRRIIINRMAPPKVAFKEATPPARTVTPSELQEQVQLKVKSTMTHVTDVSILIFATYVYLFKSAILALPIVMLLLYRQIPDWVKRKKS